MKSDKTFLEIRTANSSFKVTVFFLCSGTFSTMFCIASLSSPKKVALDKTVKLDIWGWGGGVC